MLSTLFTFLIFGLANAHLAAWHRGMYCLDGVDGHVDPNNPAPVTPLYQLTKNDWWFHHINRCDEFPPAPGDFLDLPAGGQFQVEIASNRAKTSLSNNGRDMSDWPDGDHYPDNYNVPTCIVFPNRLSSAPTIHSLYGLPTNDKFAVVHTQNETMAAGTAFAISYQSDIKQVTPDNLVVFSVRYNTPWKRVTYYDVPAAMPTCPPKGCICAWGWVPNGCGQPNMYHQAFRCRVTNAHSTTPLAVPKPPVWCEGEPDKCTKGAKQMIYWHQLDGNNIVVDGLDRAGQQKSPGYNMKTGFADGAQNDIFAGPSSPQNGGSHSSNNHSMQLSHLPSTSTALSSTVSGGMVHGSSDPKTSTGSVLPAHTHNGSSHSASSAYVIPDGPKAPNPSTVCRSRSKQLLNVHKKKIHKSRLHAPSW